MIGRDFDNHFHGAGQGSAHSKAAIVQNGHGDLEAPSHFSQHVFYRDLDIIKVHLGCVRALDSHLVLRGSVCDSSKLPLHDESSHLREVDKETKGILRGGDIENCSSDGLKGNFVLLGARILWIIHLGLSKNRENFCNPSVGNPDL